MEHAKKMVLVDPRQLRDAQSANTAHIVQPESSTIDMTLRGLERGLKSILERDDLPEDRKVDLYSHYLQQYLTMKKKQTATYRRPTEVVLTNPTRESPPPPSRDETSPDPLENEIVESVPLNLRRQATLLVKRIKENPSMGWNEKGELMVDGSPIGGSNIVDLVNDVLRSRKKATPPKGWENFARKLGEANVPAELVRNPNRLRYMREPPTTSSSRWSMSGLLTPPRSTTRPFSWESL